MKILFKTEDYKNKRVGDSYYCVQNGTSSKHLYPFTVQLIKIENKTQLTSKKEFDSKLNLSDPGIQRFHSKKVANRYLKLIKKQL